MQALQNVAPEDGTVHLENGTELSYGDTKQEWFLEYDRDRYHGEEGNEYAPHYRHDVVMQEDNMKVLSLQPSTKPQNTVLFTPSVVLCRPWSKKCERECSIFVSSNSVLCCVGSIQHGRFIVIVHATKNTSESESTKFGQAVSK